MTDRNGRWAINKEANVDFNASTTSAEDKKLLALAEDAISEMINAVTFEGSTDDYDLSRPSSYDVTRAARDLISAILAELNIRS